MENREGEHMKTYEKPNLVMNEIALDDVILFSQAGDIGELDVFAEMEE